MDIWRLFNFRKLDFDSLPASTRDTLLGYQERMESLREGDLSRYALNNPPEARPLPISQIGFVDEWRLNAYVDGKGQESLVVFTAALPFALYDHFEYLLYDARLLSDQPFPDPRLGRADEIRPPPREYGFLRRPATSSFLSRYFKPLRMFANLGTDTRSTATSPSSAHTNELGYRFPTEYLVGDKRRQAQRVGLGQLPVLHAQDVNFLVGTRHSLAHDLTNTAFLFLLNHEIAHVTRGHLGYRLRHLKTSRFAEMASKEKAAADPTILQAMELDADMYATMRALSMIAPAKKNNHLVAYYQEFVPLRWRVHRMVFAIGVLFMLLETRKRSLEESKTGTHPPHRIRHLSALSLVRLLAAGWPEVERNDLEKGVAAANEDLALASQILRSKVLFFDDGGDGAREYLHSLQNTIKKEGPEWAKCAPNIAEAKDEFLKRRLTRDLGDKAHSPLKQADLLTQRGALSLSRGQYEESISDFRRAAETVGLREDDSMKLRTNLASALIQHGKRDEGLTELDRIIASNAAEARVRALRERGDLRAREGDRAGALEDWERALAPFGSCTYPQEQAAVRFLRGSFYVYWGNPDAAIEDFTAVLNSMGVSIAHFTGACHGLIRIYAKKSEFQRTIEYASKFLEHERDTPRAFDEVYGYRASALAALEQNQQALQDLDTILASTLTSDKIKSTANEFKKALISKMASGGSDVEPHQVFPHVSGTAPK